MDKSHRFLLYLLPILAVFFLFSALSCRKNPVVPPSPKDSRTYTWTVDTLVYQGNFQTNMRSIWGSSSSDVYVVGHSEMVRGDMYHFDGKEWQPIDLYFPDKLGNATIDLSAVYGFAANDVWIVGERINDNPNPPPTFLETSLASHYDGTSWTESKVPSGRVLQSIWGAATNNIWAAGWNTVIHYDGISWTKAVKSQSLCKIIRGHAASLYDRNSVSLS